MTNKTTPDDDWLSEVFNEVLKGAAIRMGKGDEMLRADLIEAHAAINAKITELLVEAREEQVMQDFLSLNVDFDGCVDESDLIVWRQERLAQLQASQPINESEKL
jgi:hypothetical protein